MKFTALINGKPIAVVEPVTPIPAKFEYTPGDLVWKFEGEELNGCYDLKIGGEEIKPWIAGQTGEITLASGELIKFIAVKKEARQ